MQRCLRRAFRFRTQVLPDESSSLVRTAYVDTRGWCDVVRKLRRIFQRAAGTPESLAGEAQRRGQGWLCARENPLGLSAV